MVLDIGAAAKEVATQLVALGVPAVVDPRDLNLPGAWVTPGELTLAYLSSDRIDAVWDIYLIAPDTGAIEALNTLGGMLAKLVTLGIETATPVTVNLPNQGADPLPALLVSIDTTITED